MTYRTVSLTLSLFLLAGCANIRTPDAAPAPPSSEFQNLQVLPPDIPREHLLQTMRSFTRGLGVRCNHCHVVTATEPEEKLDFPSDAKETKRAARVMLQMVQQINGPWMERVEIAEGEHEASEEHEEGEEGPAVTCWTCHRGHEEPESPPPPPPAPNATS